MRPILWDIDPNADPPTYTVLLPGQPHRTLTFELLPAVRRDRRSPEMRAIADLSGTDQAILELLAQPLDHAAWGLDTP
jgi:hypothetical protein